MTSNMENRMVEFWSFMFILTICMGLVDSDGCIYEKHKENHVAMDRIKPLIGKRWSANEADTPEYQYDVAICAMADPSLKGSSEFGNDFATAGVVQTELASDSMKKHIVGNFEKAEIMAGVEWVMLKYNKGDNYSHSCNHELRTSLIMISCDPTELQGKMRVIEENKNKTEDCYYLFELAHVAVCPIQPPSSYDKLSVGSIICIVFIAVVGVYLLAGTIYQRLVVGAKGWEQIPNYAFWQDFGNLQADGCDLICRTRHKSTSREYRGIGDDQLHDDEEVGRDDSLLPM